MILTQIDIEENPDKVFVGIFCNNIDVAPKCYFRASSQQHVRAQSKNLYYSKRDVSTMVDMTSSRFSGCGSTAILLPFFI